MTLQSSGPISINDLKTEFTSSANDLLSYYRGGGIVPDTGANSGVPTSGAISLEDFYGAEGTAFDVTPSNSWWNNISGASPQTTNTVTISGIDTDIDIYYTTSGDTALVQVNIAGGGYTGWSPGVGNAITVSNGDTIVMQYSAFTTGSGTHTFYNDTDGDALLVGLSWSLTAGK
jgi:hypothetical protein